MARKVRTPGVAFQDVDPVDNAAETELSARAPESAEPNPAGSTLTNRDPETLTAPVFIEGQGWLCPEPKA